MAGSSFTLCARHVRSMANHAKPMARPVTSIDSAGSNSLNTTHHRPTPRIEPQVPGMTGINPTPKPEQINTQGSFSNLAVKSLEMAISLWQISGINFTVDGHDVTGCNFSYPGDVGTHTSGQPQNPFVTLRWRRKKEFVIIAPRNRKSWLQRFPDGHLV